MRRLVAARAEGSLNAATWDKWVRTEDKEIRSRIEEGEENTLTNLLRMGVTYTKEQPITYEDLSEYGRSTAIDSIADKRANDLVGRWPLRIPAKACWKCGRCWREKASA